MPIILQLRMMKKGDGTGYYTAEQTKAFTERQQKRKDRKEAEEAGTVVGAGGATAVTNKGKRMKPLKRILRNNRRRKEVPFDVQLVD